MIYTTNAIESVNMSLRKLTRHRGAFPTDDALMKLLYLALRNISKRWTLPVRDWKAALNRFTIQFEGRIPWQSLTPVYTKFCTRSFQWGRHHFSRALASELNQEACARMEKTEVVAGNTRISFEWPTERGDLTATLGRALEAILVPLGFDVQRDPHGDDFVSTRGDTTLTLCGVGYDDHPFYTCDVLVTVRHHVVEQLIASVIPESTPSATWTLRLSNLANNAGFGITSVRHIQAFIKFLGQKLPALVERCGHLRELDRMVNADRTRIDGADFVSAEGPIVLAWLAGNPNFESMVAYADTRYDRRDIEGDTPIVQLADHLRRTVPVERA